MVRIARHNHLPHRHEEPMVQYLDAPLGDVKLVAIVTIRTEDRLGFRRDL